MTKRWVGAVAVKVTRILPWASVWLAFPTVAAAADLPSAGEVQHVIRAAAQVETGQSLEPFQKLDNWVRQAASEPAMRKVVEPAFV